jgi:hypothetical protein
LATFIKLLETVGKGLFRNWSQNQSHVLGLPSCLQNRRLSLWSSGGETERSPPYSPDPAPAGTRSGEYNGWTSFCFPSWRASWKAHVLHMWRQSENMTEVLQSIPKEAFANSFQKLYECCQQCVVKDGDYFEGQ